MSRALRAGTLLSDMQWQRSFLEQSAPVYGRLLTLLVDALPVGLSARLELAWRDRQFVARYERPLLLLAALRYVALRGGAKRPLYRALVDPVDPSELTSAVLAQALREPELWKVLATRQVQTNELSRCVVWRWVAELVVESHPEARFSLFDVGASAGLNLVGDGLDVRWRTADGRSLAETDLRSRVDARLGFDRNPLDALEPTDATWLRACVWPGQLQREGRLSEALEAFRLLARRGEGPRVIAAPVESVPSQLAFQTSHAIAYQTVVRDYVPPRELSRYRAGMARWLEQHPRRALWVELEPSDDGSVPDRAVALSVALCRGGEVEVFALARCHPHPSVLEVSESAVSALVEALR